MVGFTEATAAGISLSYLMLVDAYWNKGSYPVTCHMSHYLTLSMQFMYDKIFGRVQDTQFYEYPRHINSPPPMTPVCRVLPLPDAVLGTRI
jgi:hypothetical protein